MKAKYIVIFFLSLLSFVACDKEEVVIPTTAPRTVLIYFAGDNSLSGYVSQNLRAIKEGIERDGLNNGGSPAFPIKTGSGYHPADRARDLRLEPELGLYRDADANNRQGTKGISGG